MIPVDGSFPNLLEWPSLLALEAGGEQARGCCQSRAQCCGTLAGFPQDQLPLMRLTPEACCLFDDNC